MWHLVFRPLDFRHCSWRRCLTVISILLVVNTAFHWTLIDDLHSRARQSDQQSAISMSRDGSRMPFRDPVISINKWYDDVRDEQPNGGKEFDLEVADGADEKETVDDDQNLITYITRKPSNRRPLGDSHIGTNAADSNAGQTKFQRNEENRVRYRRLVPSNFDSALNQSVFVSRVEVNRKEIENMREKMYTRKREIRNRSMTEIAERELQFLQRSKVKQRTAPITNKVNSNRDWVVKWIHIVESVTDHIVVDVYSNEKIRLYSKPSWLSSSDIDAMNSLAGSWVLGRRQGRQFAIAPMSVNRLVLASNNEIERLADNYERGGGKVDTEMECLHSTHHPACQTAWCTVDLGLVVAFHLDRVIGLNVTPPTVARELPVGTRHPPARLHVMRSNETQGSKPALDVDLPVRVSSLIVTSSMELHSRRDAELETAEHDRFPSQAPTEGKFDISLSDLSEKLFIFCYILKVSNCSTEMWTRHLNYLRPRQHSNETDNSVANNCTAPSPSPIKVFQPWAVPDRIDSVRLKKFKRVSSDNMELLYAGRIRQRLLQSLFLDRVFWTEAGGRHGIDIILDIIDARVKELHQWLSRFSRARKKRRKI